MTPVRRLALFIAALGVAFGGAAAFGYAVGPIDRGAEESPAHAEATMGEAATPAGLSIAENGLRLEASRTTLEPRRAQAFAFRIAKTEGGPLRSYDVSHAKRMHLIVVRRDLTGFLHLHPVRRGDRWVVTMPALVPGSYRAFADFTTGGQKGTLGVDVLVPGTFEPKLLPRPLLSASADGYVATLNAGGQLAAGDEPTLAFHVTRNGRTVRVDRYLGARGHLVILRAGDLGYLHTHADEGSLQFETTFPSTGRYRAFLQFSAGESVRTAPFTIEVKR
jgi:hypothetical protein